MTAKPTAKQCIDCIREGVPGKRPAPYPGPRCYTHHKRIGSSRKARSKAIYVEATYGITENEYQQILAYQNGRCYICHMRPGRKRLAVDHDHSCTMGHDVKNGCRHCVRGLLCSRCNRYLGRIKESVEALQRAIDYLLSPPAKRVLFPDERSSK